MKAPGRGRASAAIQAQLAIVAAARDWQPGAGLGYVGPAGTDE